jgi:chromosome partitioning protein
MAITIAIANEKGGVGKTTTAVNLAAGLALRLSEQSGPSGRVLLVDMDPQGHGLLATAYQQQEAMAGESLAAILTEMPPPSPQRMILRGDHHPNLFVIPSNRQSMVDAARLLPTLMANETRLARALSTIQSQFAYIILDTPPTIGDLLVNALVSANYVLVPVETSYLGVSGLRELQRTIEQVRMHFRPELQILGYLPTLCEEQRVEVQEILSELSRRYSEQLFPPIHKASDLAYAHSSHMDVFTYRPPRQRRPGKIASSSRATQEYAKLVDMVLQRTGQPGHPPKSRKAGEEGGRNAAGRQSGPKAQDGPKKDLAF